MQKIFFEKCLFAYEIRFAVEKKTKKVLGQIFKITLCRHQKKCQSYTFHLWNCMISIFFKKRKPQFLSPDCFIRIKQPQKRVYTSFQPFLEIV